MAVSDAYATAQEYLAGIDQDDTSDVGEIQFVLSAVSRLIDKRVSPDGDRFFTQDAAAVQRFFTHPGGGETVWIDGIVPVERGSARLWVSDIATATDLVVKVDLAFDYSYSTTLTIDTHFFLGPVNAPLGPEPQPYTFLDLVPNNSTIFAWPTRLNGISVEAIFGWPAVPEAIKRATIAITKQLRDLSKEPYTLTLENLEQRLPLTSGGVRILDDIVARYSRKEYSF